jgi:pimeloyl-ACP methyl ester carboxylesterase
MPYAHNQGVRIHYTVEGDGPPLLLHHGTSGSGASWRETGYTDALARAYQLILIDARGHGASEKLYDPAAYDLSLRAADVIAALDDLNIRRTHYFGYSMGGWIGFGLAKYAPERFHSLILGGAHPYAESMQAARERMAQDSEAFRAAAETLFGPYMTPGLRAQLMANDLHALRALTQDRASIADVLPTMTMPCLLFVGEADPRLPQVQECARNIPHVTFFSLPGCDHVAGWARSDLLLPHVTRFLQATRFDHVTTA